MALRVCYCCLFCWQDITKQTEKAGFDVTQWRKAIQVMTRVPKDANDMMNVGRLQGFNVSVCVCVCVCVCDVMSPSCLSALVRMRVRAPVEWRVLRLSSPWRFGDVRCSVCSRSVVMRAFLSVMLLVHTRVHDLVRKFGVHVLSMYTKLTY